MAFKDVEEGSGVELTKLEKKEEEETEEGEGSEGKDGETTVQLESEGENALSTFGHTESKRETAKVRRVAVAKSFSLLLSWF